MQSSNKRKNPKLKRRRVNTDQSIVTITRNCTTKNDVLNVLKKPVPDQAFKVLKLKINIDEHFDELSTTNLAELQKKFKNKSVVLFVTANNGTRFHIYWKSKNCQQILSIKPYNDYFAETDKDLCEFAADFLADSLTKGHSGNTKYLNIFILLTYLIIIFRISTRSRHQWR